MHTQVVIDSPRVCDFCGKKAKVDGKTKRGPWAYMCQKCFKVHGIGLGLGRGQELLVERE